MTKAKIRIFPDVPERNIRQLSVKVIYQALEEFKGKDVMNALDAFLWLTGADFPTWAECAGIPFADPFKLVDSDGFGKVKS